MDAGKLALGLGAGYLLYNAYKQQQQQQAYQNYYNPQAYRPGPPQPYVYPQPTNHYVTQSTYPSSPYPAASYPSSSYSGNDIEIPKIKYVLGTYISNSIIPYARE